jgi:DNA-binding transcriptional LysR family regulator
MFELRDLECFMGIVEHRSFGRAADALGMTQPGLSRRIAVLERDLGMSLISRARRQIELTAAGDVLAREAIAVLAQAANAARVLRETSHSTKSHLKIGVRSISRYVVIPDAILRLCAAYPDLSVTLSDPVVGPQVEHLRKGAFDLTVVRGPVNLNHGLRNERLRGDPLVVALPDGHHLAGASAIDVAELREEPFVEIALRRAYGYKELVRGVCANAGFIPNVVQEVDTLDTLAMCVAAGIGIALMHDASRELTIPGIVYRPLRPKKMVTLQAVWRADDMNPMIAPFVHYLKEAAKSYGRPA